MLKAILGNRHTLFLHREANLFVDEALTMGTLILGRQGAGKTIAVADHLYKYALKHKDEPIFIIDWSGSLGDAFLKIVISDENNRVDMSERIVYDPLGGRICNGTKYIIPMPEFAREHDPELNFRERVAHQVARVTRNFKRANESAATRNPSAIGRPITSVLPNLLQLTHSLPDKYGASYQITETEQLLNSEKRAFVLNKYGGRVPQARKYFFDHFPATPRQQEFKTDALADFLTICEHDSTRARLGYYRPGWTAKEAIEKGLIVICDGSGLMTREAEQDYLMLQVYSLIMSEIDKRNPSNYDNKVSIAIDEAYSLLQVPGMAKQIARMPSQYRNKGVQLYIIIQTLNQLARGIEGNPGLRENIWSFGNICSFALMDLDDCAEVAKQFFPYDQTAEKRAAVTGTQHPLLLNAHEQNTNWAYRIQHFNQRECLVKRFLSEAVMDTNIRHVTRTREVQLSSTDNDLENFKDYLIRTRGVEMASALPMINNRKVEKLEKKKPTPKNRKLK